MKSETKAMRLLDLLKGKNSITLAEAMEYLDVSESTARRIFAHLENGGYGVRFHGGIRLMSDSVIPDYSFDDMKSKYVHEKRAAAGGAAAMVESGDAIYIDSGTTLKHFSFALIPALESKEISGIGVFTSSLANFGALKDHAEVYLIGGRYRDFRKDFCGKMTVDTLSRLKFTKCFIGCDGYHPAGGFTTTDIDSAQIADRVMENSEESFIVMNSEKFMKVSVVGFARKVKNLTVVTEKKPCDEAKEGLTKAGIKIVVCKNQQN